MVNSRLVCKARAFAESAHASINHRRKYTGEPYIMHPFEVAKIVSTIPHSDEMLAAAWLHDTVEDTNVTSLDIHKEFGPIVGRYVWQLTDVSTPSYGNRSIRKAIDRRHTKGAEANVKSIKLADLISNTKSITEHDLGFAKVYLTEKRLLLPYLIEGDRSLWTLAFDLVIKGFHSIEQNKYK